MPYLHSQPSTSTSHLLAGHPNSSMDSPTSYMHSSADQEAKEGDDLLPSPSASPQQRPALQLPDGPQSSERGSKYAPRLRNAVRNLQAVKRTASGGRAGGYDWAFSGSGAEPGVDARKANFDHLAAPLNVSISQYDQFQVQKEEFRDKDAGELQKFIEGFDPERQDGKVTWINVNGLNWMAIKALALKFELHPLALEDALNYTRLSTTKVEWYPDSLFVRLLTHELIDPLDAADSPIPHHKRGLFSRFMHKLGKTSQRSQELEALEQYDHQSLAGDPVERALGLGEDSKSFSDGRSDRRTARGHSGHAGMTDPMSEKGFTAHQVVERLTKKYRIPIRKQQLAIFMTKGCVISIFSYDGTPLLSPIFDRLGTPGTVLRTSEDVSMLLHALLDVAVDEVMTIAEAFRAELDILEGRALIKPDTAGVRNLHVLSGQLLLLKRALTPVSTLVCALRQHDEERAVLASRSNSDTRRLSSVAAAQRFINSINDDVPGFLSKEARQYLTDVQDHIDSVLSSLEMFAFIANGTADFIFNSLSFSANVAMTWLTLFTVVFLPITAITGYYGMNFSIFPDIGVFANSPVRGPNPSGDIAFFWKITGPVVGTLVFFLLISQFGGDFVNFGLRMVNSRQRKEALRRRGERG